MAAAVDEQFGRLIAALKSDQSLESTIVLFVSDHGEALGREGFWVHSVFLWDSLIRVPLMLHFAACGASANRRKSFAGRCGSDACSLPRSFDDTVGYQGEDLLAYALPDHPARRYPLLLQAASKDLLVRVGLIDPNDDYKLVLSLEASFPELYDLRRPDPDASTITREQPERTLRALRELVRSPVFPRER